MFHYINKYAYFCILKETLHETPMISLIQEKYEIFIMGVPSYLKK